MRCCRYLEEGVCILCMRCFLLMTAELEGMCSCAHVHCAAGNGGVGVQRHLLCFHSCLFLSCRLHPALVWLALPVYPTVPVVSGLSCACTAALIDLLFHEVARNCLCSAIHMLYIPGRRVHETAMAEDG